MDCGSEAVASLSKAVALSPQSITYPNGDVRELIAAGCLMIGGWFVFKSVLALTRGLQSRTWPAATGVIRAVKTVKSLNSDADEISRQELEYSYSVGRQSFRGTRVRFGVPRALAWSQSGPAYRRGDSVVVRHSPSRPAISALQTGFSPFALLTLAAGGAIVWMGVRLLLL